MKKVTKLYQSKASSIDEEKRSVRFQISDDKPDRMGEIVEQDWDLKSYKANPIVLWGHDPSEPENVIGSGAVTVEKDKSFADIVFASDINAKAAMVFEMVKAGILRCVSVGFIPHSIEYKDDKDKYLDNPILKDNELLEISIVPIPANPRAVALALKDGSISQKDALYMKKAMATEIEFIEKQIETKDAGDDNMEEVKKQLADVLNAVGKIGESVKALETSVDERVKALEETIETKLKAETTQPPAKGGDNDQPGAGDKDEHSDELSPEDEAKLREELDLPESEQE